MAALSYGTYGRGQQHELRRYGLCFVLSLCLHGLLFVGFEGAEDEPLPVTRPHSLRLALAMPQEVVPPEPQVRGEQDDEVDKEQEVVRPSSLSSPRAQEQAEENYMTALYRAIDEHKVYPRAALRRSQEADIVLRITLDRRGHIVDIVVEEGSSMVFVDAARQAVLDAAPFAPFPEGWDKETLTIRVPMLYRQGGL